MSCRLPPVTVVSAGLLLVTLACGGDGAGAGQVPDAGGASGGAEAALPGGAAAEDASSALDPADAARRHEAAALVTAFQERLQGELQGAMKAGGPAHAITVCAERAPALAAELSADGPSIRRIGTRVRNVATNTPSPAERELLARLEAGESRLLTEVDGRPVALHAIRIENPVCLLCHGPDETLAPEVRTQLDALYPDDAARGYAHGDLRGAFVVEWPD